MAPANVSWSHPRVLLMLALIFASGAMMGSVATKVATKMMPRPTVTAPPVRAPEITVEQLTKDLDLTPEQAGQIKVFVVDFTEYYKELQGQMADVRANGKARILSVLNEQQKAKFERLYNEGALKQK